MRTSDTVLLFLALAAPLTTATMFSADVRVKITNGYYDAKFYYYYDESGSGNHAIRYEYSTPTQMTELISFGEGKRYKHCSSCESGFYTEKVPLIFPIPGENATGLKDDANCYQYERPASEGLKAIWYTADNKLCKAELRDGKTLIFSNVDYSFSDKSKFNMVGKECPAPVCKRVMDLVFVLDTSYSICHNWGGSSSRCDLQDWRKIQDFTMNIINSFDIANDATMVGIVTFCEQAKIASKISSNKDSVIAAIKGISSMCSATCIGCGVDKAIESFNNISEERKLLNPERMIIFMTDGGNNRPEGGYHCSNYTSKCIKRTTSRCKSYKCVERECLARDPSKCAKKKCKTYSDKCARCAVHSDVCIKKSTTACLNHSDKCTKCPNSDCCNLKSGSCSKKGGRSCRNVDCTCAEYECTAYDCAEYECTQCEEYECAVEADECEEYECTERGSVCVREECEEYACLEYGLDCVDRGYGGSAHLSGVLSKLHSGLALGSTERGIITVAIGVGSDIEPEEVKAVASKLEGLQLYYTLNDYDALTGVMEKLVQDTCINQDSDLEICSKDCLGFCGCEKKCYCPTCDSNDNCVSYSCTTDANNTMSTGCVAKLARCNDDNKCLVIERDPSVEGCCVEREKPCPSMGKCYNTYCSSTKGCINEEVDCTSKDPCFNATGCSNKDGCQYTSACPDIGKCFTSTCTSNLDSFECTYESVCDYSDPCMIPTCDNETGKCSYEPVRCEPSNGCMSSVCINGKCVETFNETRAAECAAATTNPCEMGFCNNETGACDVRDIEDASPYCHACYEHPLDCPTNACHQKICASDDNVTTYCATVQEYCVSDDPCIDASCGLDFTCVRTPVICDPRPCHVAVCAADPADPKKHVCEYTSTCKEDDACTAYSCSADNKTCIATTKCEEKPCKRITGCSEVNGERVCTYEDIVCKSSSKCANAFCNEETGKCEEEDISSQCNLGDPCTEYWCDAFDGCMSRPITCDDEDPCTVDTCVPRNASEVAEGEDLYTCSNVPKCTSELFCQRVTCSIVSGECLYNDYNCEDYNKSSLDSCHTVECDEKTRSCKPVLLASAFLDVCGGCVKTYGTNATLNITAAKNACIGGMKMPSFAGAVTGAALAGIVIAAIIVAAVLAVTSTLGARELAKRAKEVSDVTMSNNPLYEDNQNEGINPLYEGDL